MCERSEGECSSAPVLECAGGHVIVFTTAVAPWHVKKEKKATHALIDRIFGHAVAMQLKPASVMWQQEDRSSDVKLAMALRTTTVS